MYGNIGGFKHFCTTRENNIHDSRCLKGPYKNARTINIRLLPLVISRTHACDEFLLSVDISFYCFMRILVIESVLLQRRNIGKPRQDISIFRGELLAEAGRDLLELCNTLFEQQRKTVRRAIM